MECPQVGCDGFSVAVEPPASRLEFHFDREAASMPPVVPAAMPEQPLQLWTFADLMMTVGRRVGKKAARGRMALTSRITVTAR
jgi:hypothetical protein